MFDGLLKGKFFSKCKTGIKLTRTRVELVRKKRNAMQKYLKNDIIDLLRNDLGVNAYGRAEGLLVEQDMSSCYDFVEQFCVCITNHLVAMNKQSECPEECREAVSSLMFAAARFADLPELRELRSLFTGRYGNALESYANKEFVEKLKLAPPTKDMKLQLLQNIAKESEIEWNSKALEKKLYNPPAFDKNLSNDTNDEFKSYKQNDSPKINNQNGKDWNLREYPALKSNDKVSHQNGKEMNSDKFKFKRDNATTDVEEDEERKENIPSKVQEKNSDSFAEEEDNYNMPFYSKFKPPYARQKLTKTKEVVPSAEENKSVGEAANPTPRSVRRRQPKYAAAEESGGDGTAGINRRHENVDEEERMMDELLLHYSRKPSAAHEQTTASSCFQQQQQQQPSSRDASPKPPDYDDFVARLAALREN